MLRVRCVVLAGLASCGVRAPAPIDVNALLHAKGPLEARRDLVIRVTGDPRDTAGRLALAALDEQIRRPSDAIDELEAVVGLGGPLGIPWHAEDRARLGRLIAARGRTRLARTAASALADLERARGLGAAIGDDELRQARVAGAIAALRHSDAEVREAGRRVLASQAQGLVTKSGANPRVDRAAKPPSNQASSPGASQASSPADQANQRSSGASPASNPSPNDQAYQPVSPGGGRGDSDGPSATAIDAWLGARQGASPEQRGRFGAWLWRQGARRAAWDELAAWRAAAASPRDPELEDAYLVAARWWTPLDQPGAPAGDLDGAMRCAFAPCAPHDVAGDDARERAYLLAPLPPPVRDPADAAALAVITLHQALRGEASWGMALGGRIDLTVFAEPAQLAALPAFVQPVIARLAGHDPPVQPPRDGATPDQRLVIAAERVLAGADAAEIAGLLDDAPCADALRAIVVPRAPFAGDARADAVARHASLVAPGTASLEQLAAIAAAFARDPAIAERLARDAVAGASDAAAMHATLGAVFDAIGDPARARNAWQAAVDASPEPRFLRGLAEAQARQGDGDAALVTATSAAAASGDPAVVWTAIAHALAGSGRYVHALEAARSAIDLAGPEVLAEALDAAIVASRALGRDGQAAALARQRLRIAPAAGTLGDRDPTDAHAALEAHRRRASGATIARLWVASRWNPRDVEVRAALLAATTAGDPRRAVITGELVDLAGDRDLALGRAAAAALR